ncbi:V-ATPase subunit C family protein [Tritrichomonas foetus]|uniref:V-type proton ATPase subunit C n=1 Tax=Tritrichomonas foetus TaxID=1144522 RepID=A0A1J4J3I4_9EUKA|nr:V-ATPase subunit C family protein [Tritrichomonas foetus]|eukprot:OHS93297.1 V-ATPase subunit C family protein [Tritrichomonas foetus]
MSQYLLVSFNRQLPSSAKGKDVTKFIEGLIGNFGKLSEFPISMDLAKFTSQDQLVSIADELARLDTTTFGLLTRAARNIQDLIKKIEFDNERGWSDLLPNEKFQRIEPPTLEVAIEEGNDTIFYSIPQYLQKWQWEESQINSRRMINEMCAHFANEVQHQDDELRTASTAYTEAGNKIIALRRRNEGSLLVRNLDEVGSVMQQVKSFSDYGPTKASKTPIYVNTRNLITVLVVLKKGGAADFEKNYMVQSRYVVPVPPQIIESDNDFNCYAVTILRENVDDYKTACKEHGWHVRDFKYNPNMKAEMAEEAKEVVKGYINESTKYADHLQTTFTHLAVCWLHIKALRVFAESTLLYGIPPNFQAFLIDATPKNIPKIHKELEKVYNDGLPDMHDKADENDNFDDSELEHPYFSSQINLLGLLPTNK